MVCLDFAVGTGPEKTVDALILVASCSSPSPEPQVDDVLIIHQARWTRSHRSQNCSMRWIIRRGALLLASSFSSELAGQVLNRWLSICACVSISASCCPFHQLALCFQLLYRPRRCCSLVEQLAVFYVLNQVATKTCVSSDGCVLLHQCHVFLSAICFSYLQPAAV